MISENTRVLLDASKREFEVKSMLLRYISVLFLALNWWPRRDRMPDEAITTNAVSLKLPDFWPSDPELWFAQAEALFTAQNITQEKTKFAHVVRVLPAQYASEVRDIILRPPEEPYTAIKEELQKRVCPTKRQQLHQLLHVEDLGDRKPSQLLRHMLKLRGGTAAESDKDENFPWALPSEASRHRSHRSSDSQNYQPQWYSRNRRQHGRSPGSARAN